MKSIGNLFARVFDQNDQSTTSSRKNVYREWDRQRQKALGSDLAEIDAIFSRQL